MSRLSSFTFQSIDGFFKGPKTSPGTGTGPQNSRSPNPNLARNPDMAILGSAELVSFLCAQRLIDTLEIMIYPLTIGAGSSLFSALTAPLDFSLTDRQVFPSGTVLLTYAMRDVQVTPARNLN